LHIGSVRTALFNWLFARHSGGQFLLRIEDTDKARSTKENTELIFETLKWLGLDHDGEAVIQSSRLARHVEVARDLVQKDGAYRCYCTPAELNEKKELAMKNGRAYKYDGACRDRSVANPEAPHVIRLKAEQTGTTSVDDLVQGDVTVKNTQLDDLVLLRSDGTPTYMLSVVVDDHDMGVTHVIRGDDHLTNTFRQIQIYNACGWEIPIFAHIPLIYGQDGAKLSKRHGAVSAGEYKALGYLPEAICNYLMRLGWSHGDHEIISREEAIQWFDFELVGKSPARFDLQKLQNLNSHYMKKRDNFSLFEYLSPFLKEMFGEIDSEAEQRIKRGLSSLKERAKTIVDLSRSADFYIKMPEIKDECPKYSTGFHVSLLSKVESFLNEGGACTEATLSDFARTLAESEKTKLVEVAQALRLALTGRLSSPSVFEIMEILGKDESIKRIAAFIESNKSNLET
jgi:glutamyl-tRNA synthetase